MPIPAALLAAIPPAISGITSLFGQRKANQVNVQEANKTRAFAERMRNTQWQSAVTDMEAAGINPALAYSQGGAASPGGAQARVESETEGIASAMQLRTQEGQLKLLTAQTDKVKAETAGVSRKTALSDLENQIIEAQHGRYWDETGKATPLFQRLLDARHDMQVGAGRKIMADAKLSELSEAELQAVSKLFQTVGAGGKAAGSLQKIIPAILSIFMRSRR